MIKKTVVLFACSAVLFAGSSGQEKTLANAAVLISDSDLYCSFFAADPRPGLKIVALPAGVDKTILADGDQFYASGLLPAGLKEGQVMAIVAPGPKLKGVNLMFRRGRAKIVRLDKDRILASVERACAPVMVGNELVPFLEKEGRLGHDLGFPVKIGPEGTLTGSIIFLNEEFVQIGPGQWALINLGAETGLKFGQQVGVFRPGDKTRPAEPIGNAIIIDAGRSASTIKILSAKDAIRLGDLVQAR
jgi:hypothetical protein